MYVEGAEACNHCNPPIFFFLLLFSFLFSLRSLHKLQTRIRIGIKRCLVCTHILANEDLVPFFFYFSLPVSHIVYDPAHGDVCSLCIEKALTLVTPVPSSHIYAHCIACYIDSVCVGHRRTCCWWCVSVRMVDSLLIVNPVGVIIYPPR